MSKETARKWYKYAMHDFKMAKKNIEIGGYNVSVFLCNQCIEKLLKIGFILKVGNVSKTHFIDKLAREPNLPGEL